MKENLAGLLEQQQETLDEIATAIRRQADTLTIMSRHVVEILNRLTPEAAEGETALERLLAQLVAQGQEQLRLLQSLAGVGEGGEKEPPKPPGGRQNGNGHRTVA